MDAYGRSFFPDAVRFRVSMLDTDGNYLDSFGRYGMVFVVDRLNHRVLAIQLNHAAEKNCLVP